MKIREGNDFAHNWEIERGGIAENLRSTISRKLFLKKHREAREITDYDIIGDGNIIHTRFTPDMLFGLGDYILELHYVLSDTSLSDEDRRCAVDVDAFTIVARTAMADNVTEMAQTSDIALALRGKSAYDLWLETHEGTEDDYFAYLRQPATDAAASVSELEQTVSDNEGLRVTAEQERSDAELLREGAENDRIEAEGIRDENEGDRINAEGDREDAEDLREQAEIARANAEGDATKGRVKAENEREQAEIARANAEGDATKGRVKAENERVTAEGLRDEAEGLRKLAEIARANAEGDATKGRVKAENDRVAAEILRNETFDQKMGEADDKIGEMDTTLSTYEGRMSQAESDIDQLAGEVSLLDAVQGAKIKDIENVLSTANLNQSAQLSVSGVSLLSLPKNASNGGMQVKIEGLTAENLIVNGDFRDGVNNWNLLTRSGSVAVYANNTIVNTGDGSRLDPYQYRVISRTVGDVYYAKARMRVTNALCNSLRLQESGTSSIVDFVNNPAQNTWYNLAYRSAFSGSSMNILLQHRYADAATSSGKSMEISSLFMVNLTQAFGAGNEPTKGQCDLIFSDYFEGRKNFIPTGRVLSVGKNIADIENVSLFLKTPTNYRKREIDGRRVWDLYQATGTLNYSPVITGFAPNTQYIVKCESMRYSGSAFVTFMFRYTDNTTSSAINIGVNTGWSFTTGSPSTAGKSVKQIEIAYGGSDAKVYLSRDSFQVEKSIVPTLYEPYKETNLYLTAPVLRSNGTVKDEIRKGTNGYELVKRISDVDGSVLTTPEIIPISYGGVLNSASNGTVYHEPIIADAGVYDTKMDILLTDYQIATIEEIIKHENGVDTYLNVASAVVASDGLSFTHPNLASGDLVLFTYAFDKESTNGNITATFYDSNVVKIDTVTGKAYRINEVVTNGVLTRTLTEV